MAQMYRFDPSADDFNGDDQIQLSATGGLLSYLVNRDAVSVTDSGGIVENGTWREEIGRGDNLKIDFASPAIEMVEVELKRLGAGETALAEVHDSGGTLLGLVTISGQGSGANGSFTATIGQADLDSSGAIASITLSRGSGSAFVIGEISAMESATGGSGSLSPTDIQISEVSFDENVGYSATLTASDPDTPAGSISYALVNDPSAAFQVVGDQLSLTAPLDFENLPPGFVDHGNGTATIVVRLAANDGENPAFEKNLTVTLRDLNDVAPSAVQISAASFGENQFYSANLSATDADSSAANSFTYTLSSDPSGAFQIIGNQLSLLAPLDFEALPSAFVDQGNATATTQIEITVDDGANAPFAQALTLTVNDLNETPGTVVGDDFAMDIANFPAAGTSWSSNGITLVPLGGLLTFDTDAQFSGVGVAAVPGVGDGNAGWQVGGGEMLQIVFASSSVTKIDFELTEFVGWKKAVWVAFNAAGEELGSGVLLGQGSGAAGRAPQAFQLSAADLTAPPSGDTAIASVVLAPKFASADFLLHSVSTAAAAGGLAGPSDLQVSSTAFDEAGLFAATLSATDPDSGGLHYSLINDPTGGAFQVLGDQLSLIQPLDFESLPPGFVNQQDGTASVSLGISVSDGENVPLAESIVFTLRDLNDNAPIAIQAAAVSFFEGVLFTTTLSAEDADSPILNSFTYSLQSNPGDAFQIIGDQLSLAAPLDFEALPTGAIDQGDGTARIDVSVTANDGSNESAAQTLSFTLVDKNDSVASDIALSASSFSENSPFSATLTFDDPDSQAVSSTQFTLLDDPSGMFQIHGDQLSLSQPLDFEALPAGFTNNGDGTASIDLAVETNDLQGVWVLAFTRSDGNWPDRLFELADDPLVKGIILRVPWYAVEPGQGIYDWSIVDAGIERAQAIGKKVGLIVRLQNFSTLAEDALTAGPPEYIINDHETYGGLPGQGGLEPDRDGGTEFRTRRWDSEVMDKARAMYLDMISRYDDDGSLAWTALQETAINIDVATSDYDAASYIDQIEQTIQTLSAAADNIEISQPINFLPGQVGDAGIRQVYDTAVANGLSVGSPDLYGASEAFDYYDVLDDGLAPVDMSVQANSLREIENGTFTAAEMLALGFDRLNMRMMYVTEQTSDVPGQVGFDDILAAVRADPEASAWTDNSHSETLTLTLVDQNDTGASDVLVSQDGFLENDGFAAQLSAVDGDAAGTFTYALADDPTGLFAVNGDQLTIAGPLDFEDLPAGFVERGDGSADTTLRVLADDGSNPTFAKDIVITIGDRNDTVPSDIFLGQSNLIENQEFATTLTPVDADFVNSFGFTLTDDPSGAFQIVGDQLSLIAPLDFEALPSAFTSGVGSAATVELVITLDDGVNAPLAKSVVLTVNDLGNEGGPTDIQVSVASFDEGVLFSATLSASDLDSNAFVYALVDDPSGAFQVVGDQLSLIAPLDFENLPPQFVDLGSGSAEVPLLVSANDGTNPAFVKGLTLTLLDRNDTAPTGLIASRTEFDEGTAFSATLGATDVDSSNSFSFALVDDPTAGAFVISGDQLLLTAPLDFEAPPTGFVDQGNGSATLDLLLSVDDGVNATLEQTLTLTMHDLNVTPGLGQVFNFDPEASDFDGNGDIQVSAIGGALSYLANRDALSVSDLGGVVEQGVWRDEILGGDAVRFDFTSPSIDFVEIELKRLGAGESVTAEVRDHNEALLGQVIIPGQGSSSGSFTATVGQADLDTAGDIASISITRTGGGTIFVVGTVMAYENDLGVVVAASTAAAPLSSGDLLAFDGDPLPEALGPAPGVATIGADLTTGEATATLAVGISSFGPIGPDEDPTQVNGLA